MGDGAARYYVYWIQSGPRAYIGATVDPRKRLRQHNGEIVGGAARTRNRGPWRFHCVISGFRSWQEALQYEWAFKYYSRRCRGIAARRAALDQLNARERWTSNSPLAREVPLTLEYEPSIYGGPPDDYQAATTSGTTNRRASGGPLKKAAAPRRRRFKKTLGGVTY